MGILVGRKIAKMPKNGVFWIHLKSHTNMLPNFVCGYFLPRFSTSCVHLLFKEPKIDIIKDHAFLKTEPLSILFNHDDDNIPWAYPEIPKVDPKRKQSGFCLGKIP